MSAPVWDLRRYLVQVPDLHGCSVIGSFEFEWRRFSIPATLTAVSCAVLSGANGYKPLAQWLKKQSVDFRRYSREFGCRLLMCES